jgi:hypothetical protein
MDRQHYLYLITDTYFETKNPVASEPAEPMFDLQMKLFRQILIRKQKVAEREDFITKDEFLLQCELALDHIKEYVGTHTYFEITRLHRERESIRTFWFDENGIIRDIPKSVMEDDMLRAQNMIDDFDENNFLVDLSGLYSIIKGKLCNYEVEFLEEIIKNIDIDIDQLQKPEPKKTKSNKSLLFDGKELNLSERFKIANKVLDIDSKLRTLNIKDLEKYQLLAYILGCDKDNARNIMNGSYKSKDRDLTTYFDELNLNK